MDDTHSTLGRSFRTPAHPDILAALGRALYCFLSLEESLTAVMYDSGAADLSATRSKTAGAKEKALKDLADRYRTAANGSQVAALLDAAADAFGDARQSVRNEMLHAHPFTVGYDAKDTYLPGLAHTAKNGQSWKTVARSPEDLLDLAARIEQAIDPLSRACDAVNKLPLSALQP